MTRAAWPGAALVVLAAALALLYGLAARHGVALSDEYVYIVGARYFADTGSLDARYYSANALLAQGYPHQDMHPPGYAILLGAALRALPFGPPYWTAVIVNVLAWALGALAVRSVGRSLGVGEGASTAGAVVFLLLPGFLPYVFWALPEVVVGALLIGLVAAAGRARSAVAAVAAGVAFGAALLVRESVLFALPAVLVLTRERRRTMAFLGGVALLAACAYYPLSRNRAEGGTNFWRATTTDSAFAFDAVREGLGGAPLRALQGMRRQLAANRAVFARDFSATEKAILALYLALPCFAFLRWRTRTALQKQYLAAAAAGLLALLAAMAALFTVPPWSGVRYLMSLPPLFLPFLVDGLGGIQARAAHAVLALALLAGAALDVSVLRTFNAYKLSRQARQQHLTDYVDRYMGGTPLTRVVLENGWLFGLRHYPVEVLTTPPPEFEALRVLQRELWFEYVAAAPHSGLAEGLERSGRYEIVNGGDSEAPLSIYRRRRW